MKKLAPRERKLVVVALCAVAAFLAIRFALFPFLAYYERLGEEMEALPRDLLTARRAAARFAELQGEVEGVRARLARRKKEFNPYASLSEMARRQGLSTEEIQTEKTPLDDRFQEVTAKVTLRKVPLPKLVGYLYDIEHSPDLMTVKVLSVNADADGTPEASILDATLDASTVTGLEGGGGAAEKKAPAKKTRGRKR